MSNGNSHPRTADIGILGAGVMGASIAFHLARRKARDIIVIDKDHVGRGGSGSSSALISMHYSYPPEVHSHLSACTCFSIGARGADPDNFPQRAADESLEEIIERACRCVPKLENAEVMRGVTGVYDMAPDARPLLGEIPWVAGLHVCAGFSGMGFKISPAIDLVMLELLLDRQGKTVDINSFRPCRFTQGQPIKAEYEYVDD